MVDEYGKISCEIKRRKIFLRKPSQKETIRPAAILRKD